MPWLYLEHNVQPASQWLPRQCNNLVFSLAVQAVGGGKQKDHPRHLGSADDAQEPGHLSTSHPEQVSGLLGAGEQGLGKATPVRFA